MNRALVFIVAMLPILASAQGQPDLQLTFGIDFWSSHKTAIEPTTINHVIVDSYTPVSAPAYFQVTTNILSPTPSSHTVQIPIGASAAIYPEVSRSGGASGVNVALRFASINEGILFSVDSGTTFQLYTLPSTSPYTNCNGHNAIFGPDGNLYVDYMCLRAGGSPIDRGQLRRLIIDPNGVATPSVISMTSTSGNVTRSVSTVATGRYVVTHFSPGPTYSNVSIGAFTDVPAVAITDTQTSTTTIRHVGKPPPAGGTDVTAYNTGKVYLASDGKSVFIANPAPLVAGAQLNRWKVWQLPENGGDFLPNNVAVPSWPPIHDLSLRTDGTDVNAYMTLTQTAMRLGQIFALYAPYDPSGNNTKVRMSYLTPDQRVFVGGPCSDRTVQVVDLVNPNAGAISATPMFLEDFPVCVVESIFGGVAHLDPTAGMAGYYQLPGGFLTSYGIWLSTPQLPAGLGIHFADLTP